MGLHAICVLRTTDLKRIRVVIGDEAMLFIGYHVAMRLRSVFLLRRYAPLSFQLCLLGMPWGTSAAPVKAPGSTCFTPAHAPTSPSSALPGFTSSVAPGSRSLSENFYQSAPFRRPFVASPDLDNMGHVGPFAIEHSQSSPIPLEQGRTVTAAYPVKGVQGMDLVVNAFGGHRQTNTGSNAGSAAITAGVRFKW